MMQAVISLSDVAAESVGLAGGKGAGLARLIRQGFSVPEGVVVTTEVYRSVVAGLRAGSSLHADPFRDGAGELGAALRFCVLSDAVEPALVAFVDPAGAYAVRSSATLEDLAEASFAGQHETVLGCVGVPAIAEAIRRCFASLWDERAVAYRARHGIAAEPAAMAVVVQRMVAARAAGVAFTLDPVGGRLDQVHVSAHAGLGEGVVNGEDEVDRFVFAKDGLAPVSAEGPQAGLCLTAAEAAAVARVAVAIEAAAGFPQDVEWAIDHDGVRVLQARPVTAIPPRWTRDESAERFPNVVTPLAWDLADAGFHAALDASFARMGLPPMRAKWFACFDGYVYGNQNAVELYLGRPLMLGNTLEALRAALPELVRRFAWVEELPGEWATTLDRFLVEVGRLDAVDVEQLDRRAVWAHVQRINAVGRAYFRHNIAISIGHAAVHRALRELLGRVLPAGEAAVAYDALVGAAETRTALIGRELDGLARLAREDAGLLGVLRGGTARAVLDGGRLAPFPAFAAAFAALLRDHGHRELDIDPYHAAWAEAPWTALEAVCARLDSGAGGEAGGGANCGSGRSARTAAAHAVTRLMAGLPDDLAVLLHELARLALLYSELDDNEHYQTSRLGPLLRRAVAALGRGVAADGVIGEALDLFFVSEAALAAAVASGCWEGVGALARDAKAQYLRRGGESPAWCLGEDSPVVEGDAAMSGIPGSPGRARGPAYIVRSPADFAGCPAGAIMVVRATTPAWTVLFARVAGVVAESGGPLSHGAIAAREQGIPAVMGVRGAMERVVNGQVLEVDGGRGLVL